MTRVIYNSIIMKVQKSINFDKFCGDMGFGGSLSNTAPKFNSITDIDKSVLRVPFNSYDESLTKFKRYYLETSKPAKKNIKNMEILFKDQESGHLFYPLGKYKIGDLSHKIMAVLVAPQELLSINHQVQVQLNFVKRTLQIYALPTDFVQDLKVKISNALGKDHNNNPIPINDIKLFIKDKELSNEMKLPQFAFQDKITLNMSLKNTISYNITLTTLTGKKIQIEASPFDLIQEIKQKIQNKQGIPPNQQLLIFAKAKLEQGKSLNYYNIVNQSALSLILRLKGGCFDPKTHILISKDQWLPISSLKKGMKILSYNVETKTIQEDEVTKVVSREMRCMISIVFEDGAKVECTPNHLFLTSKGQWKRYQYRKREEQLTVGEELISYSGHTQKIAKIQYKDIEPLLFYHICVKNNHNFIVEGGVIAHNMQIHLNFQNQDIFKINNDTSIRIKDIKEQISRAKNIPFKNIKLRFAGKQLNDDQKSLSDFENEFGSGEPELYVRIINPQEIFGTDSFQLTIKRRNGSLLKVQVNGDTTISMLKQAIKQAMNIAVSAQLLKCNGWSLLDDDKPLSFYKIYQYSLVTVDIMDIGVRVNFQKEMIFLKFNKELPIRTLQMMVQAIKGINTYRIKLFQKGKELNQSQSLQELKTQDFTFYAEICTELQCKNYRKIERLLASRINIKIDTVQSTEVQYSLIREWTVAQTIQSVMKNAEGFYCLMLGKLILKPFEKIREIQKSIEHLDDSDLTMIVLKNSEKLEFYKSINLNTPFPSEHFPIDENFENQQIFSRNKINSSPIEQNFKNEDFYRPIHYYTGDLHYRAINKFLREIKYTSPDVFNAKETLFISSLVNSLNQLPNYQGLVHRGQKEFRISNHLKDGDCFYWKNFASTSILQSVADYFKQEAGVLYHINSLTGKDISLYSLYDTEKEILFPPFTYFIIDRIQVHQNYDEVWMSEMPSPVTFHKNILVWVDDMPGENAETAKAIQERGVEVIQLTSTRMAEKWTQEFNWLLNWMDVKLKVVSDMVRVEDGKNNYFAGVDLLDKFYNIKGYSTPILVFCSDVQKGKENAEKRKVKAENIQKITNDQDDLDEYVRFQ